MNILLCVIHKYKPLNKVINDLTRIYCPASNCNYNN